MAQSTPSLLSLPDNAIAAVLGRLDARALVAMEQTHSYFSRREPGTRLPLVEHTARAEVLRRCGGCLADAERFRWDLGRRAGRAGP